MEEGMIFPIRTVSQQKPLYRNFTGGAAFS
jgi:hypothetical protein